MKRLGQPAADTEIRRRLQALTAADQGRWGVLSVNEMLAHVGGAFTLAIQEFQPLVPARKLPVPASVFKFCALHLPVKWPAGVETVPQLKREAMPPAAPFAEEQTRCEQAFTRFLAATDNHTPHPIFGAMQPADWMRWGYLHADLHLRQFGR